MSDEMRCFGNTGSFHLVCLSQTIATLKKDTMKSTTQWTIKKKKKYSSSVIIKSSCHKMSYCIKGWHHDFCCKHLVFWFQYLGLSLGRIWCQTLIPFLKLPPWSPQSPPPPHCMQMNVMRWTTLGSLDTGTATQLHLNDLHLTYN